MGEEDAEHEDGDEASREAGAASEVTEPSEPEVPRFDDESADRDARPVRSSAMRGASVGLLVVVLACLGGAVASWIATLLRDDPPPRETVVIRPTADVVVAVRDLARLESASYHMERVIDMTARQARLGGLVQAEDSILLVAAADVVAGVDLADLRDGDVVIEPDAHRATITLPPVRVLSARLDNGRTYVYRRETDLLAHRRESLETQARREAEETLEHAAIEAGILDRAERNARRTIEALVRSLGYAHVEVRFREE